MNWPALILIIIAMLAPICVVMRCGSPSVRKARQPKTKQCAARCAARGRNSVCEQKPPFLSGPGARPQPAALTRRQQAMYWLLAQAFPPPRYVVVTQMNFDDLLNVSGASGMCTLRRPALFLLANTNFRPIAVVELTDPRAEGVFDALAYEQSIRAAGYELIKYSEVPTLAHVIQDVSAVAAGRGHSEPS